MTAQGALAASVLVPLLAAALIALLDRWPNVREAASLLAGAVLFASVVAVAHANLGGVGVGV